MKKFLFWLPRVLAILIVIFFALFILEGFGPDFGWQASAAHAVVALIALGATILAWKRPQVGGWLFVAFGIYYLSMAFNSWEWTGLLVGGVPLLTGILFLVEGFGKKK